MSPALDLDLAIPLRKAGPTRPNSDFVEVNFDGLVGPTHNYAGLSRGNLASAKHADAVSHPKLAALQGLAKVRLMLELGVPQGVIPPQVRPDLEMLRSLGFHGSDADVVFGVHRAAPRLLAAVYSSSAMWAANAATVSPSPDTSDGKIHLTPANLLTQFHRSIEPAQTAKMLRRILSADCFVHHDPLPAADAFADEGAANHLRLCGDYGSPGLEISVYGRDESTRPAKYPARQTRQACEAIARRHGLMADRTLILRQSPEAIDAGAFHNDVVAASNQNVLLVHRQAFADAGAIDEIRRRFDGELWLYVAEPEEISLADAVSTYVFNTQIVSLPDGSMSIIAPVECQQHAGAQQYLSRVLAGGSPVKSVHYVDLRQSMNNGGGPACLRLRVVMPAKIARSMLIDQGKIDRLCDVIQRRYRNELSPADLADPALIDEARLAVDEIRDVLGPG
jgi:succinylarginine dihydrolase